MSRLDERFRYYAFISYNHRDEREAKWLQRQLEHYRLPSVARKEIGEDVKIRPVFRYAVNLSLGDLRRQVREELDASRFLIVICSPNSAQPNIEGKHWVNDEATRFIETGRVDDIIPVIVDGEPNVGGDRECFPPVLRNREIAGANLSKGSRSERRRDFLKIVAKLLGILPDQLIRHTEEEEKRARFHFWLKLLPLAILAAVGGLFAWDSTRTVKNYYADYVDSYGLPEGIFPLKKAEIAHRDIHYRFEYRGFQFGASPHADSSDWCIWKLFGLRRRLVRVVQSDSRGKPFEFDHPVCGKRPLIQHFTYDHERRLCEIRHVRYNDDNRNASLEKSSSLEKRIELSNVDGVVNGLLEFFTGEGRLGKSYAMSSIVQPEGSFMRVNSEITQHTIRRDKKGHVAQELFRNSSGDSTPNGDGIYGFSYEYDDLGRPTAKWNLFRRGDDFERWENKRGIAGCKFEYEGRNVRRITYVDSKERLVVGPHGWMVCRREFDTLDNITHLWYEDENGKKTFGESAYVELRNEYDDKGNMIRVSYFGADGKPALCAEGYADKRWERDSRGNATKVSYFGVDGKPTLCAEGYADKRWERDSRGNATKVSYFGVDGKPTLDKDGIAERCLEHDSRGNLTKASYFGVDGKPTLDKDGVAEIRWEDDSRGNLTKASYFGVDGKPTLDKDGIAEICWEHDSRGNLTKASYFGVDGKPTLDKDGIAEICWECDSRGNLTKASYFGVDGKPALNKNGIAEIRTEYDSRGNLTKASYFGVDGKPTLDKDGIAEFNREYDRQGRLIRGSFFDADGKPTIVSQIGGWAEVRFEYDKRGNKTKESYFGVDGKPMAEHCKIRIDTSEFGNALNTAVFDAIESGKKKGFAVVTGDKAMESSSDDNGMLAVEIDGVAEVRTEYDDRGNRTRISTWGIDGKLVANSFGVAEFRYEYDVRGNVTKVSNFGPDEKPVPVEAGVFEVRTEYDARGNKIRDMGFGPDGELALDEDGVAENRYEYDARGNVTKVSNFGLDGKPTANNEGVFEERSEYGIDGKVKTISLMYAVAGVKSTREDGIAEERRECDRQGNVTKVSNFGLDGKPKADKDGVFERRYEYDEDGNRRKDSLIYAVAGVKGTREDGIAEVRFEYDARGNVTKVLYFGSNGKPKADKDGVFEMRSEYDEDGNRRKDSLIYAVADAKAVREDGIAEVRFEYDERGKVKNVLRFDVNGKQIAPDGEGVQND